MKAALLDFDELQVISLIGDLYEKLEEDNEKAFCDLAYLVYLAAEVHGDTPPKKAWLKRLLKQYDAVTLYVYINEVKRKRDRAAEAINATSKKSAQFKKQLSYWQIQTAQYADIVTDSARIKAYQDAGVKRVRWNTQEDEKVCEECKKLNGQVFEIDKAPEKRHYHCRCYYTPVLN